MDLFHEPEKAAHSEATVADNKIDHLKKIVEDAAKRMGAEEPVQKEPPQSGTSVEGENLSSSNEQHSHIQGENPIFDAPKNPSAPESPVATESPSATESPVAPEGPYAPESPVTTESLDQPESPIEERFLGSSSIEEENFDMLYDDDIQSELEEMGAADYNAAKLDSLVEKLVNSFTSELQSFDSLRQSLDDDNKTFQARVEERLTMLQEDLASENSVMDALAQKTTALKFKSLQLFQSEKEVASLRSERAVISTCVSDVHAALSNIIEAHDPILNYYVRLGELWLEKEMVAEDEKLDHTDNKS
ncbi:uncharacterized protein LOC128134259 [Lactuca sativa]|uniref:uncharacterized protein LOC128134259 n=1 Tax=Lactuca sativa TaxID=4236 RepID=UPI0022AE5A15|nr:uncharacterized protein LOC128134259 [Lactuca sativa]